MLACSLVTALKSWIFIIYLLSLSSVISLALIVALQKDPVIRSSVKKRLLSTIDARHQLLRSEEQQLTA